MGYESYVQSQISGPLFFLYPFVFRVLEAAAPGGRGHRLLAGGKKLVSCLLKISPSSETKAKVSIHCRLRLSLAREACSA